MRRVWMVAGIGFGVCLSFITLLVVGTYSAAAGLASSAGGAVGLAKGAVPAAYQPLVQRWGTYCASLNPAMLAAQLHQESGCNPTPAARSTPRASPSSCPAPGRPKASTPTVTAKGNLGPRRCYPAAAYDCKYARDVEGVPGDARTTCSPPTTRSRSRQPLQGHPSLQRDPRVRQDSIKLPEPELRRPHRACSAPSRPPAPSTTRSRSSRPLPVGRRGAARARRAGSTARADPGRLPRSGSLCPASPTTSRTPARTPPGTSCCRGPGLFRPTSERPGHPPRGALRRRRVHDQRARAPAP